MPHAQPKRYSIPDQMEGLPQLRKFLALCNANDPHGRPSQEISFQIPKGPSAPKHQITAGTAES